MENNSCALFGCDLGCVFYIDVILEVFLLTSVAEYSTDGCMCDHGCEAGSVLSNTNTWYRISLFIFQVGMLINVFNKPLTYYNIVHGDNIMCLPSHDTQFIVHEACCFHIFVCHSITAVNVIFYLLN